jgi:serine/threonine protein kinase
LFFARFAVKETKSTEEFRMSLRNEARVLCDMKQFPHKNVVSILGICSQKGPLVLIEEYAEHNDLKTYLQQINTSVSSGRPLYTNQCLKAKMFYFALQIAKGMEFLASRKVVHRDLAARNVLVFRGEILKICDFGLAKDIRYTDYYRRRSRGGAIPIKWMAPEALKNKIFTEASDVWSYGIVLWEITTLGGSPYPGIPNEQMYNYLENECRMSCPKTCPLSLYDIMLRCWEEKPFNRPTFAAIVNDEERISPSNV